MTAILVAVRLLHDRLLAPFWRSLWEISRGPAFGSEAARSGSSSGGHAQSVDYRHHHSRNGTAGAQRVPHCLFRAAQTSQTIG